MHAGEEVHAWPGWTTSRRGQDSPWKNQSEWQRTGINGESTSMVWPTLGSRTAKEQNRFTHWQCRHSMHTTNDSTISLALNTSKILVAGTFRLTVSIRILFRPHCAAKFSRLILLRCNILYAAKLGHFLECFIANHSLL